MDHINNILTTITDSLCTVPGIDAIVLGGSRARETYHKNSDIDIGIYYNKEQLNLTALETISRKLDDAHNENIIAAPGQWGNWVNGGGWLVINGQHVDFILRDINRVKNIIEECQNGIFSSNYQTGHPHGYMSYMYMGELAISKLLWKKNDNISTLKIISEKFPSKLKSSIIDFFTFEANFSYMFAENNLDKDDTYYVVAHFIRAISALNQILFALNEQYCINEKKAVQAIETFNIKPINYKNKVENIFLMISQDIKISCEKLKDLIDEIKILIEKSKI